MEGTEEESSSFEGISCLDMSALKSSGGMEVNSGVGRGISFEEDILTDCLAGSQGKNFWEFPRSQC